MFDMVGDNAWGIEIFGLAEMHAAAEELAKISTGSRKTSL